MKLDRSFGAGLAIGILITLAADAGFVLWVDHVSEKNTRIDLFTPVGQVPSPTFPDVSQVHIYGTPDPNWGFRSPDGKPVKLADFRGKVVFLHFWATWCGGCREELAYLRWLQDRTRNLPVSVVLLSEETPEKVSRYLNGFHFSTLAAYTATEKSPPVFYIVELPTTFIIDRDGRVVYRYVGYAPWGESCLKFLSDLAMRDDQNHIEGQ